MADDTFMITKKKVKGEDGNRVVSVRIKNATLDKLEDISRKTNRSRNDIINILLEQALEKTEIGD